MKYDLILKAVNNIFIDVLDDDGIVLKDSTSADDIEEWDSLNHIQLVVAVEQHFKLKFTSSEIRKWKNVGEMCTAISKKISE